MVLLLDCSMLHFCFRSDMPANNTLNYYLTLLKEMFMMFTPSEEEKLTIDDKLADNDNKKKNASEKENEEDLLTKAQEELQVQKALVVYLMVNTNVLSLISALLVVWLIWAFFKLKNKLATK